MMAFFDSRLLNFLNNKDMLSTMRIVDEDQVIGKVMEDLTHVEDMLDDCLQSLQHYTGTVKLVLNDHLLNWIVVARNNILTRDYVPPR